MLEHTLSEEEHSQIVQTIEMFEVITQTQSDDYQSLEILKEAYQKVGKQEEYARVSRRLAEAYFNVGSYTLALQECEAMLLKDPDAPDVLALLSDIETKLQASGHVLAATSGAATGLIVRPNVTSNDMDGSLLDPFGRRGHRSKDLNDHGDEQLAKLLISQGLAPEDEVQKALETATLINKNLTGQATAASLLEKLCRQETHRLDRILSAIIDRTKFAFVPLESYDLDWQLARMLPDHLTLGRLFIPFDLISRTMMVACANPFDHAGREAVQQSLDYTVTWYLARPGAIELALKDVYRLEAKL